MSDFLTQPGFLGTRATLRSDLTLVLILVSVILLNFGFIQARRKKYSVHHWVQTGAVILNSLVVIISMVTSFIIHILPGIPNKLGQGDYLINTIHGIIGAYALLLGVYIVIGSSKWAPKRLQYKNYKLVMRLGYGSYMLATLAGIAIYIIVFVLGI